MSEGRARMDVHYAKLRKEALREARTELHHEDTTPERAASIRATLVRFSRLEANGE